MALRIFFMQYWLLLFTSVYEHDTCQVIEIVCVFLDDLNSLFYVLSLVKQMLNTCSENSAMAVFRTIRALQKTLLTHQAIMNVQKHAILQK